MTTTLEDLESRVTELEKETVHNGLDARVTALETGSGINKADLKVVIEAIVDDLLEEANPQSTEQQDGI